MDQYSKYENLPNLANYLVNEIYKNRSVFLHVGQTESTQRAGRVFCPQINIETKMVIKPHGTVNYNLIDFSSYLFRNVTKDYFNGVLQW